MAVDLHNSFIALYPLYLKHRQKGIGITFLNPSLLLLGFCIENLLKAYYLKQGGILAASGKLNLPNVFKKHNLVDIAQFLKIQLSIDEKEVLRLLTLFITTIGRYPVGLNWELTRIMPKNRKMPTKVYWADNYYEISEEFIKRLRSFAGTIKSKIVIISK